MFGKGIDFRKAIKAEIMGNEEISFDGISTDSRTIKDNEVFLALKGPNFDGHSFIESLKGKAKGFIVDKEFDIKGGKNFFVVKVDNTLRAYGKIANYWRRKINPKLVGITGSLGKTTTKELVGEVLSKKAKVLKTEGNLNNIIGLSKMLLSLRDQKIAVLEMGINNFGEMAHLCEIAEPDIGIVTNIAPVHLEGLKSLSNIYREKTVIFDCSKEAIFINKEDSFLKKYDKEGVKKVYFGKGTEYSYGSHRISSFDYMMVNINAQGREIELKFPYINLGLPIILALAVSVGKYFNVSDDDIKRAIQEVKLPKLRMEVIDVKGKKVILDAYNSNPVSLKYALKTLMELEGNKKSVVLGDIKELGRYSKYYHVLIAKVLIKLKLKEIILVGDEMFYTHTYLKENKVKHNYFKRVDDAKECFDNMINKSDIILIKGSRAVKLEKLLGESLYAL